MNLGQAFWRNFLGSSPPIYKGVVLAFLILNPLALIRFGYTVSAGLILMEFIVLLLMRLACHPLQAGGLIALQAVIMGLTTPAAITEELLRNYPVFLLIIFMVSGILFARELLFVLFTRLFLRIAPRQHLPTLFFMSAALLSAFLGASPVIAVIVVLASHAHTLAVDSTLTESDQNDFRRFLRGLLMHSVVGASLGGVCTLIGEPQNLLIGNAAGWRFVEYFQHLAPVSLPVLIAGTFTCILLERFKAFNYGHSLTEPARSALTAHLNKRYKIQKDTQTLARLWVQAIALGMMILALVLQSIDIGLLGLVLLIVITAANGITDQKQIGSAFVESLPFAALLVVFFTVVSATQQQHLLQPVFHWLAQLRAIEQPSWYFFTSGLLSCISDSVFTATIYINEISDALDGAVIARAHFDRLAIAISAGTSALSIATPHGQSAFLLILASGLARRITLSYRQIIMMTVPYTLVVGAVSYVCVRYALP